MEEFAILNRWLGGPHSKGSEQVEIRKEHGGIHSQNSRDHVAGPRGAMGRRARGVAG